MTGIAEIVVEGAKALGVNSDSDLALNMQTGQAVQKLDCNQIELFPCLDKPTNSLSRQCGCPF